MNINDCASAECGKGTCIDGISSHSCNCSGTGYDGTKCENDVNECDSTPCDHNATCSNYGGGYTCKCNVGYSGKNCENNIDDCALRPCKNGGKSNGCHETYIFPFGCYFDQGCSHAKQLWARRHGTTFKHLA